MQILPAFLGFASGDWQLSIAEAVNPRRDN
jgi:hypothetical protein